ncbi:hypothetical protein BH18CHL1_BH18CHL1_00710 [soil metagenome]
MKHRHLDAAGFTTAAIDDILERGRLTDWVPLLRELCRDPFGPAAERVMRVVEHHPMFGTSTVWRRFVARRRAEVPARGRPLQ